MFIKKFFCCFFLIYFYNISAQGIRFDRERFEANDRWEEDDLGFSSTLPSKFSLRQYCPPIMEQTGQSCVGWSTAYAAMSIIHNQKFGMTKENEKFLFAFDPNYIYSLIAAEHDYDCAEGTYIDDAIETMTKYGCKKMLAPELTDCNSVISNTSKKYGLPFRIKGAQTPPDEFFEGDYEEKVTLLKQSLLENNPLIVGMATTETFGPLGYENGIVSEDGLYNPKEDESEVGGHAMCVIGFDDEKFGGSFEIMNSWGIDFGDQGFNWVKYDDFLRLTKEIYKIETYPNNTIKTPEYSCLHGDCDDEYSHSIFNDGHRFEGECKNGNLKGFGLYYFDNGDLYAGQFKMGTQHGSGMYYHSDEEKWYYTYFRNGELLDEESLGFGETSKTTEELQLEKLYNKYENLGIIKVGEINEIEDLDFKTLPIKPND